MNTELVDGDLKAAIEQYKKVAEGGDRALAAQALVRMAECYRKLGDAQAQAVYRRIARDFGDQADAVALARSRLAEAAAPVLAARGDRAVWTGPDADLFGTVSPDGRYLTYVDWASTGNLMLRDLKAGVSRPLTGNTTIWGSWRTPATRRYRGTAATSLTNGMLETRMGRELRIIHLTVGASSTRLVRGDERRRMRPFRLVSRWAVVVGTHHGGPHAESNRRDRHRGRRAQNTRNRSSGADRTRFCSLPMVGTSPSTCRSATRQNRAIFS